MAGLFQLITSVDRATREALGWLAGRSSLLDWLARVGADDHIVPTVLVLLTLSLVLIAKNRSSREGAFSCLLCSTIAGTLSMMMLYLVNQVFFRPRPFTSYDVVMLFYRNTDSAFPSNAATVAFVLAFSVLLFNRRVGYIMVALAAFAGVSRVVVGVHYPLDVLAGMLLGGACALLSWAALPSYRKAALGLADAEYRLLASWRSHGGERGEPA